MSVSVSVRQARPWPEPRAVVALLKPVTWFPPMWAFACGVVSAGVPLGDRVPLLLLGLLLTGPVACASSQAVNDWFDRFVDAVNEPDRPIPSGRIPGRWGLGIAIAWSALALVVALPLGPLGIAAAAVAVLLSWAYSAPPFRLKRNGWLGNAAVGVTYEGLAWVTGAAIALGGRLPPLPVLLLAALYSAGAHGIMTLNDFKAIEGDRRHGVRSLPVRLGVRGAAWAACATMLAPQVVVAGALLRWSHPWQALLVVVLVAVQALMMRRFLAAPRQRALWLSALGVPFYVTGMMIAAVAVRADVRAVATGGVLP